MNKYYLKLQKNNCGYYVYFFTHNGINSNK